MEIMSTEIKAPLVSIIIPNYNGEQVIGECLESVYKSDYNNFEVILVDDASVDNSISIINEFIPYIRIIKNKMNLGFTKSVNKGIKEAKGKIIILLNMDSYVKENWLSELVKIIVSDKQIGIVGSKILNYDRITIQHAGGIIGKNGVSFHIGKGEIDKGQYNRIQYVDYVCGASMGFRKDMIDEIGYLDEGYSSLYYEDTDLAFHARKKGYKVAYVPDSVLIHKENYSTKGLTKRFYYLYHKNRIRFIIKNYSPKYLFTEFIKAEIKWFSEYKAKEFGFQLLLAYLINLLSLPKLIFNPSQKYPVLKPGMNGICFSAQEEPPDFIPGNFTKIR